MIPKNKNIIFVFSIVIIFLISIILSQNINESLAAPSPSVPGLEVQYPTIADQTITAETKLPDFVKYFFNLGMFLGFLIAFISLTVAGALYFLPAVKIDVKADAKDRIIGAISGMLILVLTYLIITTINPQLSFLKFDSLPPPPPPSAVAKDPGVYFYTDDNCKNDRIAPNTASIPDFGKLKNKINSVGIIQSSLQQYISILYDNPNLWGKCLYLNPNEECQATDPFSSSASIHRYNAVPNGDGVYFFREPCFNTQNSNDTNALIEKCEDRELNGGYTKINNDDIKVRGGSFYIKNLEDLKFEIEEDDGEIKCTVPKEKQDCTEYTLDGRCKDSSRKCPALGGENISSMIINGNYVVLFFYYGPGDPVNGPWTSCQEFPQSDDLNNIGAIQIKWENIRNNKGVIPNYILIMPVQ